MDPETAEIIISQCYQQPCCSEKAEAVMSRPPLASPGDSAESDGCAAPLRRGVRPTGWDLGQVTLWLFLLCLSCRDHGSASPLPEPRPTCPRSSCLCCLQEVQQLPWGGNRCLHSCTHGQLCLLAPLSSHCLSRQNQIRYSHQRLPPHSTVWAVQPQTATWDPQDTEQSSSSLNSSAISKEQIDWPRGRADTGGKPRYGACAMDLVTWASGDRDPGLLAELLLHGMNRACAGTLWRRWLFLILLVRGRWHPFIQIVLFSVPHAETTGRNVVRPLAVAATYLPGTLNAGLFSVLPAVDFTGLVHLTMISMFRGD